MKIVAGLLLLFVVYVWVLFLRRHFRPVFVVPAVCVTLLPLFQAYFVLNDAWMGSARLFGGFALMTLLFGLLMRPKRNLLWLLTAWLGLSASANIAATLQHPIAMRSIILAVELLAIASLIFIGLKRTEVLDRPVEDIGAVFE